MDNKIIDNIIFNVDSEKEKLKARLDQIFTQLTPSEKRLSTLKEMLSSEELWFDYYRRLFYHGQFLIWQNCFWHQIEEVTLTILETAVPYAFQVFVNQNRLSKYLHYQATVNEAYNYLVSIRSARSNMILSLLNNGHILYEYIKKHDYDGFLAAFTQTKTGSIEFLETCGYFICDQQLSISRVKLLNEDFDDEISNKIYAFFSSKDGTERLLESIAWRLLDGLKQERDNIIVYEGDELIKKLKSFKTQDEEDEFWKSENLRKAKRHELGEKIIKQYSGLIKLMYIRPFLNFIDVYHEYKCEYINDIAMDVICNEAWRDLTIPLYFELLEDSNYSIENDIINRISPKHLIVTKAKEYLVIHKEKKENKELFIQRKGRKKSSWIKGMNDCPEENLGHLFKETIWPELEKRLKRLTYKDVNDIDLRGRDLRTAIQALGACFIFYVTDSLGYAERTWVSFERTTKIFLEVTRNTISSYMSIFDEYDRWLMKDKSSLDIFKHKNPKYYKLLLYNIDSFTDIISYLTPRIKKLFEENLTMKSKD